MRERTRDFSMAVAMAIITATLLVTMMGTMAILARTTPPTLESDGIDHTLPEWFPATPPPRGPSQVPVLCYHYIRGGGFDPIRVLRVLGYVVLSLPLLDESELWTVSAGSFARQMQYLYENGYRTVPLSALDAWQRGEGNMPLKPIVITFDDGDRSVYEYAYPILERYGFTATCFVVTGRAGERWREVDNLSWEELHEMRRSGVFRIESHTDNLHYKVPAGKTMRPVFVAAERGESQIDGTNNWRTGLATDLLRSREAIRENTGSDSNYLAWPYGSGGAGVDSVANAVGFRRTCEMHNGNNARDDDSDWDASPIGRHAITARISIKTFIQMVRGTHVSDGDDPPTAPRFITGVRSGAVE